MRKSNCKVERYWSFTVLASLLFSGCVVDQPNISKGPSATPSPTQSPAASPHSNSSPTPDANQAVLPTQPGTIPSDSRVVVNIPAFRMDVFESGRLIKTYRIGVGYPEFPIPVAIRKAEQVIFNPTWTPPDEPWVESSNKVKPGETIPAGDKLNPLGVLKIPIGGANLIHGGKSPAQIGNFASHGCVGLTDSQAIDFAKLIARLGGMEIPDERIEKNKKNRTETDTIQLKTPVPVELRYESILVQDGKLYIFRDLYNLDTNSEQNLSAVLQANGINLDKLGEPERNTLLSALKEMSRDPAGRADQANPRSAGKSAEEVSKEKAKPRANETSARVTRTIKGPKEAILEVPGLSSSGYPSPVALDEGKPPQPPRPARRKRR